MKQYFNPDISSLREVPEAVRKEVLGLASEPDGAAPDLMQVNHLLHMISVARELRAAPALR